MNPGVGLGRVVCDEPEGALHAHAGRELLLDDHVAQIPADPAPVCQDRALLRLEPAVSEIEQDGGLGGEALQNLHQQRAGRRRPQRDHHAVTAHRPDRAAP